MSHASNTYAQAGVRALIIATAPVLIIAAAAPQAGADVVTTLLRLDRAMSGANDALSADARYDDAVIAPMLRSQGQVPRAVFLAKLAAEDGPGSKVFLEPVRAGVSADRTHGFTLGHLSVLRGDGTVRRMKYLAYWIKRPQGWRIFAFKRVDRPAGPISVDPLEPSVPAERSATARDVALARSDADSLDAAERAFSAEAQTLGLGPSFVRHGSEDAINMGTGPDFTIGAERIGNEVASGASARLRWAPDGVIVAPTGDLGLSWGYIRSGDPAHAKWSIPFFTIWRRSDREHPWRYVAE